MPPAHKRNIDDSRSETSSTVPNHKDGKNGLVPTGTAGHSKANRAGNGSTAKAPVNVAAVAATVPAITIDKDPKLPRVCYKCPLNSTHPTNNRNSQQADWVSTPNSVLRTYRIAYRLQAPSTFCHAHADIIHKSSATALRSPSAVLARRRLREEKHRRRKLDHLQLVNDTSTTTSNKPGKSKNKSRRADKDKDKDGSKTSTLETSSTVGSTVAQSIEPPMPHKARLNLSLIRRPLRPPPRPPLTSAHPSRPLSWPFRCASTLTHNKSAKPTPLLVSPMSSSKSAVPCGPKAVRATVPAPGWAVTAARSGKPTALVAKSAFDCDSVPERGSLLSYARSLGQSCYFVLNKLLGMVTVRGRI